MRKAHFLSTVSIAFLIMVFLSSSAWAVPGLISYQGQLTDPDGFPVNDPALNMSFRIYDAETDGSLLWHETQTVDVQEGVYNVKLGFAETLPDDLFDNENVYLEVEIEGESAPMAPRQKIMSVPFAMKAGNADTLDGLDSLDLQERVTGSCDDGSSIKGIYSDGTVKCNNLADHATLAGHATTADHAATADHALTADNADNAALFNGEPPSEFAESWHFHHAGDITDGILHQNYFSAFSDLGSEGYLGNASGDLAQNNGILQLSLNADLLDGNHAAAFSLANHNHIPGDDGHTHSTLSAPDGSPENAVIVDSFGNVGIGTSSTAGHQLNVMADESGKSAMRGVDYDPFINNIRITVSEGQLGVESPAGLPSTPGSVGVLGKKTANGTAGVAVYGWNSDNAAQNYGMYAVADGSPTAGSNYGIYAVADGSPGFGSNFGIYAKAENGPTNWAGYFVGDVKTLGNIEATGNFVSNGVTGNAIDSSSFGVYGSNTTNGNYGYLGSTNYGAYGSNTTNGNYGYLGSSNCGAYGSNSTNGNYGYLGSSSYGVYGRAARDSGTAVRGFASAEGDTENYGGHFKAAGANGRGVYGYASDWGSEMGPEQKNYGGYFESAGLRGVGVYAKAANTVGTGIYAEGGSDGYAAEFVGNVKISSVVTGNTVMELGEGLDYAEGFDVSSHQDIEPGAVMIIDPENPGKLTLSREPYDTKVAGIVAGANGLGSGVRLGADQFDKDVALAGRVYCNVDATKQAVKTGDLLTTSDIPGYAMKAADYSRAHGAILGKAMEKLDKGKKGQILVLVTLQ